MAPPMNSRRLGNRDEDADDMNPLLRTIVAAGVRMPSIEAEIGPSRTGHAAPTPPWPPPSSSSGCGLRETGIFCVALGPSPRRTVKYSCGLGPARAGFGEAESRAEAPRRLK